MSLVFHPCIFKGLFVSRPAFVDSRVSNHRLGSARPVLGPENHLRQAGEQHPQCGESSHGSHERRARPDVQATGEIESFTLAGQVAPLNA